MALTDKLSAIGVAIRAKTGKEDLLTLDQMPTEIAGITTGGNEPTAEELTVTGECSRIFSHGNWNWFINKYNVTTEDITNAEYMFYANTTIEEIPFQINITDCKDMHYMFYLCNALKVCPKIRGTIKWSNTTNFDSTLQSLNNLRYLDDMFTDEMMEGFADYLVTSTYSLPRIAPFYDCNSLRRVPSWWYKFKLNPESPVFPYYSYTMYPNAFYYCYTLDEAKDIPVWVTQAAVTSNMFNSIVKHCDRLKGFTFETNEDGSPIVAQWKSQTIDFANNVGHATSASSITKYNSGITADKEVTDDATYQALKDDPDWFTVNRQYSRYNHDSAVETINSLPDTSAYLATAGGTNTIRFTGAAGELTDGGAINTLTEEEIAVATAKGWTVTLV